MTETLRTQCTWLGLYFFFNLALTLFNKAVLGSFPFPYTLTGIHTTPCVALWVARSYTGEASLN